LPILVRAVAPALAELRACVAGLYFLNSVGATVGGLLADFWWIPSVGMPQTQVLTPTLAFVLGPKPPSCWQGQLVREAFQDRSSSAR
jgi:predicted membrane-bound spermidine synthase